MRAYPLYIVMAYIIVFMVKFPTIRESFHQHQNLTSAVPHHCMILNHGFIAVNDTHLLYANSTTHYTNATNFVNYNISCDGIIVNHLSPFIVNKTKLQPINSTLNMWEYNTTNNGSKFIHEKKYIELLDNTPIDIYYLCMWILNGLGKMLGVAK